MKKVILLSALFVGLLSQSSFAQTQVQFPTGIAVGDVSAARPAGYAAYITGGILTEKVRVATVAGGFWADYVFEPTFKLRSFDELESFIKLNKHLPDVPSSKEVSQNGIDLAQTDALLLQKIEELTLYMIEQNKKINNLEKKVKRLSKK